MKPFTAWLAMGHSRRPDRRPIRNEDGTDPAGYVAFSSERVANRNSPFAPKRVLIVADTPENRKKLGMEEG